MKLVGGPEPGPLTIAEYDETWPERFARERERIRHALGARAQRIEHIGSTAVPGLAAKPVVDILVVTADPEDPSLVGPLRKAGYELRVIEPRHRMFRTDAKDVHVHVWPEGEEARNYIRLRELLRRDGAARGEYEQLKRDLAKRDWASMDDYADAKGPFIRRLLRRAAP